ncbi:rod shape-determining protein RodA [Campylobacter novaezeelandiae]|uniref:Rod shape-determining protein RodA n=1 Tax=Campylobacter novaezeelandiae TaxID=2267891 RepID=A0A4Q9JVY0_9BACT|nr:FtsW/RodA/SpoVE family cell cycle protein [Campylobacter novaezeelandiae]MBK1963740.1 rod shape-determining protein RodA [Campylobacter novaezeelandiae]MBK1993231.1 rod shape-determining protein RodA [Campylobacter novaezeelandiae]QWU79745.1 rod shape-determining protein [Campylobacter novaezeelandiae]TBR78298.1 rod shape-determining protein RodA [Campylobacter novaezeelandiae]TBR79457.1 rod shape-determining protein RodA [Campylobacter novaezeelandiae]
MFKLDRRILTHFDYIQPILILPIILISFFLVFEANTFLAEKQFIYTCVGFLAFSFFFLLPLRKLIWLIPVFYWLNIALLLSVDIFGVEKLGAKRWLEIPFTHFTIQPSEIFKPFFILMLAYLIHQNPPSRNGYNVKQFLKLSFYILLPFLLITKEPDLGTATILLIVGFGVLFIIGVNYKIWLSIFLALSLSSPLIYTHFLKPYQKQRIHDFLSEKPSYQVIQSMIAIGNGGLTGKTYEEATQTHFKFLPISTSDFIFAYMIERFGFLGGLSLIILYILLILHLLSLNYKLKEDYFARVAINAVALFIFIYAAVNISMTIGFAPVVGVPLPFFSHGGSSFTTFMVFFGILQHLITFRFFWTQKIKK